MDADFDGAVENLFGDLGGVGGERKALIFSDETRSYSSMRFARSSSEVMETRASRSSEGNWQRRCLTEAPQSSSSFSNSSVVNDTHAIRVYDYKTKNTKHKRDRRLNYEKLKIQLVSE